MHSYPIQEWIGSVHNLHAAALRMPRPLAAGYAAAALLVRIVGSKLREDR